MTYFMILGAKTDYKIKAIGSGRKRKGVMQKFAGKGKWARWRLTARVVRMVRGRLTPGKFAGRPRL